MMEFLFLDLDDTILDFHKAERIALSKTLAGFGLEPTEEVLARYHVINRLHWERLERGELTRDQVLEGRFRALDAVDLARYLSDRDHWVAVADQVATGAEGAEFRARVMNGVMGACGSLYMAADVRRYFGRTE